MKEIIRIVIEVETEWEGGQSRDRKSEIGDMIRRLINAHLVPIFFTVVGFTTTSSPVLIGKYVFDDDIDNDWVCPIYPVSCDHPKLGNLERCEIIACPNYFGKHHPNRFM